MPTPKLIQDDIKTIVRGIGKDAQKFSGKTILISGGSGFLGRYFLGTFKYLNDHVLKKPCRVISVDNYITGSKDPNFNFGDEEFILDVWGDVTYPLPIRQDLDYIIHAAGLASPVYYMQYPLETIESAFTGAKNLLELARKNTLDGFLFFSSSEIYGDPDPKAIPTPETYHGNVSSVGPRACYDESKRLTETVCSIYHQKYNIPVKIVRPFNVFGPGMKHNDKRVVPMFAYHALNNKPLPVHGDGHQTRTFCYITDAMTGFFKTLLIGKPGEAYNIGNSDNEMSMRRLGDLFGEVVGGKGYKTIPYPKTYPAGEPQRRCPDLTKAKKELHYEPRVSLKKGLQRFMQWADAEPGYHDTKKTKKK
jgi:UDP-glucuronate decarboxylase